MYRSQKGKRIEGTSPSGMIEESKRKKSGSQQGSSLKKITESCNQHYSFALVPFFVFISHKSFSHDFNHGIDAISSKLLACCSRGSNKINVIDLETKQEYTNFHGAQLKYIDRIHQQLRVFYCFVIFLTEWSNIWTHLKEIPNSRFVVSLNHCWDKSASMMIFDISQKGKAKEIYSFEEIRGSNCSF